jgi:HPt (histidine-containing phosphotransfer) domain-containing protein
MMRYPVLLSMAKAIGYLGDGQSAQHLLATLEGTLASDIPQIEAAILAHDFELLQTKWHQLKGFAPVFCADALVEEISQTERLCKTTSTDSSQNNALQASTDLLTQLKQLQSEVLAQLASPPPP